MIRVLAMSIVTPHLIASGALNAKAEGTVSHATEAVAAKTKVGAVTDKELKVLKTLDANYQSRSASMKVSKVTKIPLLDQERRSKGTLIMSGGRLRMELEGTEKSLLVVNKKTLWAVTYPPAEFKDAAVQVIKADTSSKKGRSQSFITLLSQGGFLKFFMATAAVKEKDGILFFLTPREEQVDFKRAQVKVSSDGKKLLALNYWDDRDNETRLEFSDVKDTKIEDKMFNYAPPANADIMNM